MRADFVIVGGGVIGSSIALHLRERAPAARVIVVERDGTYARASSRLATGGVRQQFASPLNVQLARYSAAFYARMDERLRDIGVGARIDFRQLGYLFLVDAASEQKMRARFETMHECGAKVEWWTRERVESRVPELKCDDMTGAIFGPDDGYLDPRAVLRGLRELAERAGAEFVEMEARSIVSASGRVTGVRARAGERETFIAADTVVNAAGAFAADVARGTGVELPIHPVRQHLFRLQLARPLPGIPMIFDPDGTHWRGDTSGDATRVIIGRSKTDEPAGENFACDLRRLHDGMLPAFERRHPSLFSSAIEGWAGLYEMTPDHNGLVGEHPALRGFVAAAGFSGHGLMMAPAIGVAVAELVGGASRPAFDVAPLAPDRFARNAPFLDEALV